MSVTNENGHTGNPASSNRPEMLDRSTQTEGREGGQDTGQEGGRDREQVEDVLPPGTNVVEGMRGILDRVSGMEEDDDEEQEDEEEHCQDRGSSPEQNVSSRSGPLPLPGPLPQEKTPLCVTPRPTSHTFIPSSRPLHVPRDPSAL